MISWKFLSGRRRLRLEKFVKGASTLEEALMIFRESGVSPPADGSLEALFKAAVEDEVNNKDEAGVEAPPADEPVPLRPNFGISPRPVQKKTKKLKKSTAKNSSNSKS